MIFFNIPFLENSQKFDFIRFFGIFEKKHKFWFLEIFQNFKTKNPENPKNRNLIFFLENLQKKSYFFENSQKIKICVFKSPQNQKKNLENPPKIKICFFFENPQKIKIWEIFENPQKTFFFFEIPKNQSVRTDIFFK